MSAFDDLDREIDQEMGWAKKPAEKDKPNRRGPDYWHALLSTARATSPLWRTIKAILRPIAKVVFFPIISPMAYSKRFNPQGDMIVVKRSLVRRFFDGIFTRMLLTPVILAIFMIGIVYASTHPKTLRANNTPDSFGLYFKPVTLVTVDNQRLSGWFIPPIDANSVSFDPINSLSQTYPAAVVCHGLGATHDQYLPLAKQLHDAGIGVLMIDMRGQGESDPAAVTFGLRERLDVLAGVKFLRETPYIDPAKVVVIGHDMGAMAALQATALDSSIRAAVADGLWPKFQDRAREIFAHPGTAGTVPDVGTNDGGLPTQWLAPLYATAFEVAVRDRLDQIDPATVLRNIHSQPVLFVVREGPEYAPVQDVMNLAGTMTAPHEVITPNDESTQSPEERVRDFVMKATDWHGANARGQEEIRSLLKSRVQEKK